MENKQEILDWYMKGFKDELSINQSDVLKLEIPDDKILQTAYNLGQLDAIVGDDIPSLDYRSEDEILQSILNACK